MAEYTEEDIGIYAVMENGSNYVVNHIMAHPDFDPKGYWLVKILDGVFCQKGMYYNENDGLFYQDPEFTYIRPRHPHIEEY